jgi:hypothetical protein
MNIVRAAALPAAIFFGVFAIGTILFAPPAPVRPAPASAQASVPAQARSRVLDILAAEADGLHNGTISPGQFQEWQARMEVSGAADAADAPNDDVVLAAAIGTTPDVVQHLRDNFRERGISGDYTDRLLYGIAEELREGRL